MLRSLVAPTGGATRPSRPGAADSDEVVSRAVAVWLARSRGSAVCWLRRSGFRRVRDGVSVVLVPPCTGSIHPVVDTNDGMLARDQNSYR